MTWYKTNEHLQVVLDQYYTSCWFRRKKKLLDWARYNHSLIFITHSIVSFIVSSTTVHSLFYLIIPVFFGCSHFLQCTIHSNSKSSPSTLSLLFVRTHCCDHHICALVNINTGYFNPNMFIDTCSSPFNQPLRIP